MKVVFSKHEFARKSFGSQRIKSVLPSLELTSCGRQDLKQVSRRACLRTSTCRQAERVFCYDSGVLMEKNARAPICSFTLLTM